MSLPSRIPRVLSAFDRARNQWAAVPLCDQQAPATQRPPSRPAVAHIGSQTLSLTTWNIQASQPKPGERAALILDHILQGPQPPDIVFLQEVASSARESVLNHPGVRSGFLTTDAEDAASFAGVPFATMTLLSRSRFGSPLLADQEGESDNGKGSPKLALDSVFRTAFPSRFKRDALCVSIAAPGAPGSGTVLRLLNVHLDSLDSQFRRALEMRILAGLLREPGCSGGVVAGDFNAIDPLDETLVDKHGLVDAWVALRGTAAGGATWGVGVEFDDVDGRRPGRLDKVVMLGVQPCAIDVLQPGLVGAYTRWSDHCGLRCTFAI